MFCRNKKNNYFGGDIKRYMDRFINKIIQGDCLDIMPLIPDKSIDMILCDLPYG